MHITNVHPEVEMVDENNLTKTNPNITGSKLATLTDGGSIRLDRSQTEVGQAAAHQLSWENYEAYKNRLRGFSSIKLQ
jgi:hypothetical protein